MHSFTTVSSWIAVRTTIHYSNVCCTEGAETYYRRVDLLICGLFQVEGRHELTATWHIQFHTNLWTCVAVSSTTPWSLSQQSFPREYSGAILFPVNEFYSLSGLYHNGVCSARLLFTCTKRRHAKLMTKNNQLLSNTTLYSPWELHLWKNVYSTSDRVVCALLTSCYSGSPVPPSEAMDIEKTLYLGNFTELIRSWSKNKASVLCVISVQGGLN